jgi:hypothetical protein
MSDPYRGAVMSSAVGTMTGAASKCVAKHSQEVGNAMLNILTTAPHRAYSPVHEECRRCGAELAVLAPTKKRPARQRTCCTTHRRKNQMNAERNLQEIATAIAGLCIDEKTVDQKIANEKMVDEKMVELHEGLSLEQIEEVGRCFAINERRRELFRLSYEIFKQTEGMIYCEALCYLAERGHPLAIKILAST